MQLDSKSVAIPHQGHCELERVKGVVQCSCLNFDQKYPISSFVTIKFSIFKLSFTKTYQLHFFPCQSLGFDSTQKHDIVFIAEIEKKILNQNVFWAELTRDSTTRSSHAKFRIPGKKTKNPYSSYWAGMTLIYPYLGKIFLVGYILT